MAMAMATATATAIALSRHATPEAEHQVKSALLLDVVVGQGAPIFKLLASENQALLIRRNAFLILDFGLNIINSVRGLNIKCDGLARKGLNEDLHATAEAEHQVKSALLLDVVIRKGTAIFQLLSRKDQALLVRRDALLVLDFCLNIVDGVRRLDV